MRIDARALFLDAPLKLATRVERSMGSLIFTGALAFVLYSIANAAGSHDLAFEWDEWTILLGSRSGPDWLLQEHIGHFFPLGRALFGSEAVVFGFAYENYVLVNLGFLIGTSYLLFRIASRLTGWNLAAGCIGAMYVLAHGQYVNVMWAIQIVWFLTVFFMGILLLGVARADKRMLCLPGVGLLLCAWLSFGSALIALPSLLFVVRLLAHRSHGTRISRSDIKDLIIYLGAAVGLVAIGGVIIKHFPPPHAGAITGPLDVAERVSETTHIVADTIVGYGFFGTAPVVPGALSTYGQRPIWGDAASWLVEHPFVVWMSVVSIVGVVVLAGWRVLRKNGACSPIWCWIMTTAATVGVPVMLTSLVRTGPLGGPLTPRYDTFLLFSSLIALLSLLGPSTVGGGARASRSSRAIRYGALALMMTQLAWLTTNFAASLDSVTAWRDARADKWEDLSRGCRGGDPSTLTIPAELQPELTAADFCWIVAKYDRSVVATDAHNPSWTSLEQ